MDWMRLILTENDQGVCSNGHTLQLPICSRAIACLEQILGQDCKQVTRAISSSDGKFMGELMEGKLWQC
jgi:hypothetical protein